MKKLLLTCVLLSFAMAIGACASPSLPPLPVVARCPVLPAPPAEVMVPRQPNFRARLPQVLMGLPAKPTASSGN